MYNSEQEEGVDLSLPHLPPALHNQIDPANLHTTISQINHIINYHDHMRGSAANGARELGRELDMCLDGDYYLDLITMYVMNHRPFDAVIMVIPEMIRCRKRSRAECLQREIHPLHEVARIDQTSLPSRFSI